MKMYSFLECSFPKYKGRTELILDTFNELENYIKKENIEGFKITYIKEKYGGLRFEFSGGNDTILDILLNAENLSHNICEECGKYGKTRDLGRIRTLCSKCFQSTKKEID